MELVKPYRLIFMDTVPGLQNWDKAVGGTSRNGPRGMPVEREPVETCKNQAKISCPSKTEIPEIRNNGWRGF
jgi:hypothetical protein